MVEFRLEKTCWACPEQYDVYIGEEQVGYLRLRHGHFRCDYPDCGGETLYDAYTEGDGMFEDEERDPQIRRALAAIIDKMELKETFEYKITSERYDTLDEEFPL